MSSNANKVVTMSVNPIPKGYHSVTPYLIINGAARAIDFYEKVFDATEVMRMADPSGKVGHAEIQIGDCRIMLADAHPEMGHRSPQSLGGSPVGIHLYLKDVDGTVEKAVAAGAKLERPVTDQFYGDRSGQIRDPFGHLWTVSTHKEDLSPEEMGKRAAAARNQK